MIKRGPFWLTLQAIARSSFTALFDVQVYGVENVPSEGGAIIAANHQSYLDPPMFAAFLDRPVNFMAKSELFENPYFGWFIRQLHAFPIRQGKGDRSAIVETVKRLEEGALINIYPEGSRTEDGEIAEIQPGIALVIRKAKVPVVPAIIEGAYEAWPKKKKLFHPHPIRIMYGPPLMLHDLPGDEIVKVLDRTLRTMMTDLRAFPPGGSGEPITARISPLELEGRGVRRYLQPA